MTSINPLKFGVTGNNYYKQSKEEGEKTKQDGKQVDEQPKKQIDSKEVLGFLAAQNADIIPVKQPKTLDVNKFVSPEQEARIGEFMAAFENDYDEALKTAMEEFPGISPEAADAIALACINSTY